MKYKIYNNIGSNNNFELCIVKVMSNLMVAHLVGDSNCTLIFYFCYNINLELMSDIWIRNSINGVGRSI